eukprot:TRINITY_DN14201_c0_g1_i1.p1 TRINITY_DN14201_c0_g1~~TRINITY_DN14201_c0_g1_i1.p1  ORF type:complete len:221 (+),score=31.39 TRINITY_DN14201_c0_g1_i1:94-756(+)
MSLRTKWHEYYRGENVPWDSRAAASQLVAFVVNNEFSRLCRSLVEGRKPQSMEIGCGTGSSVCYLGEQGFKAHGVDLVPDAIAAAKTLRSMEQLSVEQCIFEVRDAWELGDDESLNETFDFMFDCQTFHVLRQQNEAKIVDTYFKLLAPGGLLMVMTGNSNEPEVGPSVLTEDELRRAFDEDRFECLSLTESRFDSTPAYAKLSQCPLAWVGVFRKRQTI